jgi:hypothetical protein
MKKFIFGIIFLVFVLVSINAQTKKITKVYFAADEYINNTPGIIGEKVKIRLDLLFKPTYILIKTNGKKKYFPMDSIWGFSVDNQSYRFYNERKYTIINNIGMLLYTYLNPGRHFKLEYYFSNSPKTPIELLTIKNLETSFKDNEKFCKALHHSINSPNELTALDEKNKTYKVISLYKMYIN